MAWYECHRCQKRMLLIQGQPLPYEGYCGDCFETVTGRCAECRGSGQIQRAHLGTLECFRCEGTGQAPVTGGAG